MLNIHFTTAEEVSDRVLYDLLRGYKPQGKADSNVRLQKPESDENNTINIPRYGLSGNAEEFDALQDKAVEQNGVVMPGLNYTYIKLVEVSPTHPFNLSLRDADLKKQVKEFAIINGWIGIAYLGNKIGRASCRERV